MDHKIWLVMCLGLVGLTYGYDPAPVTGSYGSCDELPCRNGSCYNSPYPYCVCNKGYTGTLCETEIATCNCNTPGYSCYNGGTCVYDEYNGYYCNCTYGTYGQFCEYSYGVTGSYYCDEFTCMNGNCSGYPYYYCMCNEGYTGTMCETDIATYHCNATDRMCYNGGTCLYDEYYGYYCNCSYGTYGQFCEYSYGVTGSYYCDEFTCMNGNCSGYPYYYCMCNEGYTGTMCETDIATYHCNATDRMCYNGGTCLYDEYYGYYCNCSYGTYGQFCEYSYGVTGSYYCDEYTCMNGNCSGYPYYYCMCNEGYTGTMCETDIATYHCNAPDRMCYNGATCLYDEYYGYYCNCSYGTYGQFCEYGYGVTDFPWYTTSDYYWPPVNYTCLDYVCHNGGHCVAKEYPDFYCLCPDGFTGAFCEYITDTYYGSCGSSPCLNGGECFDMGWYGGYKCLCPMDGMGYNCEHYPSNIDPCTEDACYHGTCYPQIWGDGHTCFCDPDYTGYNCDIPIDDNCGCVHGSCPWYHYNNYNYNYNNYYYYDDLWNFPSPSPFPYEYYDWFMSTTSSPGEWKRESPPMQCHCEPGYTGEICDIPMTSCYDRPCYNGGRCTDFYYYGGFSCECPAYFTGTYCEQGIWGDWYDFDYGECPCGQYQTRARNCLAGEGRCEGRSVEHVACDCSDKDDIPEGLDIEIAATDIPMVTQHEEVIVQIVAHILNDYCGNNLDKCCGSFGYGVKQFANYYTLVEPNQCLLNYIDFTDTSVILRISAYTTLRELSEFCDVSDKSVEDSTHDDEDWDYRREWRDWAEENGKEEWDESNHNDWDKRKRSNRHNERHREDRGRHTPEDYFGRDDDWYDSGEPDRQDKKEGMVFVSSSFMHTAVKDNEARIEAMLGVDIKGMEPSAQGQTGDDNDDDDEDDDDDHHHHWGLVIGLATGLGILALILLLIGGVFLYKKLKHPKNTRQATPEPPAVSGAQGIYHQPVTPHDLFLVNGPNGLPPAYQQVVMYPGSPPPMYGLQNPMPGNYPVKTGPLPPINEPEVSEDNQPPMEDMEKSGMNNNPVPPSAAVYNTPVAQSLNANRLPPIHKE